MLGAEPRVCAGLGRKVSNRNHTEQMGRRIRNRHVHGLTRHPAGFYPLYRQGARFFWGLTSFDFVFEPPLVSCGSYYCFQYGDSLAMREGVMRDVADPERGICSPENCNAGEAETGFPGPVSQGNGFQLGLTLILFISQRSETCATTTVAKMFYYSLRPSSLSRATTSLVPRSLTDSSDVLEICPSRPPSH